MAFSTVCMLMDFFKWMAFGVGTICNVLMSRLIIWHTPKLMRIYSKILLQTCAADLLLLIMTILFIPYTFTTNKGEQILIAGGLINLNGSTAENHGLILLASVSWTFLVMASLFSYVSQFIYRYLLLNWNKNMSTFKYLLLFFTILFFPFLHSLNLYISSYPPADHRFLEDQSVADILGQNVTDPIALVGYSFKDWRKQIALYYLIIACTCAYIIILSLAFLMHKFLKEQSKKTTSSLSTTKLIEMNKQISRNLIIQASMPLFIYLSVLFMLALKCNDIRWHWIKYYNVLCNIPMFLPSALNPIFSISIIKSYRNVFAKDALRIAKRFKILILRQNVQSVGENCATVPSQTNKIYNYNLKPIA